MKIRSFFEGAGIAILALMSYLVPVLSPYHVNILHGLDLAFARAAGLAIDLAILTLLCFAIFTVLERRSLQKVRIAWAVIAAFVVVKSVDVAIQLLGALRRHVPLFHDVNVQWSQKIEVAVFCGAAVALLVASKFLPVKFGTGVRLMRAGLAILGCCILWMLPNLITIAILTHSEAKQHAFSRPVPASSPSHGRVIWVLFDELSYDQVYQHRQPGLELPHFDELKTESVVFSNVVPEGFYTERVVPALLLDRRINDARGSLNGDLSVHVVNPSHWERFNEQETIFANAKRLGWTTGVAGWYNPYCHLLPSVLDSCYSRSFFGDLPTIAGSPILGEAAAPLFPFFSRSDNSNDTSIQSHIEDYRDLMAASLALIKKENIEFAFLHLPVPHPPAIYVRKTGEFKSGGSYLDNVALVDKAMGDILNAIQNTTAANRTTLIVSSDHSWRVPIWRGNPGWTAEEEQASGGRFDPRPFLLIRFPGEVHGEVRSQTLPELETNPILSAMFSGQIKSRAELDSWLQQHRETSPNAIAGGSKDSLALTGSPD